MAEHRIYPWWAGYFLLNPVRRRSLNPEGLLGKYIVPGMTVMDAGCAMGFFSLPMARLAGAEGKVICIDPQKRMLDALRKKAAGSGLSLIIDTRLCTTDSLMTGDLKGRVDLALAFGVLHEVRDRKRFVSEICSSLKQGAVFVFGEPHVVSKEEFDDSMRLILESGFVLDEIIPKGNNKIAVLRKNGNKVNYK